jgi:hypothetical protein
VDISEIQTQIATAEEINQKIRAAHAQKEKVVSINVAIGKLFDMAGGLSEKIADIDIKKNNALKKAEFPVNGLSVDETGVVWNDIPIDQASSAEQLRISLAIAMALNPELRVIRITNASLLDSNSMAIIEEMARDKDYQVWVELVDETGKIGIVIEDGTVKAVNKELQNAAY